MHTDTDMPAYRHFMKEVERYPLLSPQRTAELARRKVRGDRDAWTALVEHNLRLVVAVALRSHTRLPLLDAIQEGTVGLMRAVDKYDPELGWAFSTYAVYWIRQAIQRAEQGKHRTIRLPHGKEALLSRMRRLATQRESEGLPPLTIEEWAAESGLDETTATQVLAVERGLRSLDAPLNASEGDTATLGELLAAPAPDAQQELEEQGLRNALHTAVQQLEPRDRHVLTARWGLDGDPPRTLAQIGQELQVTKERVRQLEKQAMHRLRDLPEGQELAAWLEEPQAVAVA